MADPQENTDSDQSSSKEVDTKKESSDKVKNNIPKNGVELNKDITIYPKEPLPQFDKKEIKAYRASGKNKVSTNLIAYICEKSLTPRHDTETKYQKLKHQSLVKLVGSGAVYWPAEDQEKFCFVYENTLGEPIVKNNSKSQALGWRPEDVLVNVVHPMIVVMTMMRQIDLYHGQIWPGNMYYNGSPSADKVTLGECLTTPSAYHLPALYEPVERALADPISRGRGTMADDLYSFGVSLAVMLRAHDPMAGATDKEVIESKIEKGTYITLLSKDRLSGNILELMRGLLYDDPLQRWTFEDLEAWLDGQRLTPKQSPKRIKATRPFSLGNNKYVRPELLAIDMTSHSDEIARLIESGELNFWIERAVEDKTIKLRVEQMLKEVEGFDRTDGHNERLSAAVAIALYPDAPIDYNNMRFHAAGFAKTMTRDFVLDKNIQNYTDIIRGIFIISFIRVQKNPLSSSIVSKLDNARKYLSQKTLNAGFERALYYLNPECPCLSPILKNYYALDADQIILAFEDLCLRSKPPILFDRHIISYISLKDRRNIDPYLIELSSTERHVRILAQIRVLATIQKRSLLKKCPALTQWVADNLEDVYARFHDSHKREKVKDHIEKLAQTGDLTKIALFFDDPALFNNDMGEFYDAIKRFQRITKEKDTISGRMANRKNYGEKSGQQVASVISMVVSFVIIVIAAYYVVTK